MIAETPMDFCDCGGEKKVRDAACRACWNLAPQELRDAFRDEPDRTKRRALHAEILEAIRAARNGGMTFGQQPQFFMKLVLAKFAAKSREETPIESMEEARAQIDDVLTFLSACEHDGDGPSAVLENLADLAVVALRVAHSVVIPAIPDERLRDMLDEWQEVGS